MAMSTEFLKKIAVRIGTRKNSVFTYPVDKQKEYVNHFPEPKDGFERAYYQYCCQMKLYGKPIHIAINFAALPLSLYYLNQFGKSSVAEAKHADAVFFNDGKPFNIIPDSVLERYSNIITLSSDKRQLRKEDKVFLKSIFRKYPFSWMLWLKTVIKIAQYSYAISTYAPNAIISCSEFSFVSPILTEYCHTRGVKLINVMHGEKLYYMRDTFACYDEYYVWDQYYVDLLTDLRADKAQFRVELPASMQIKKQSDIDIQYDYTYYLAAENKETLQVIADALRLLQNKGKRISVRPHPRYSNVTLVRELFDFANIEDYKAVTIEQSLLQTGNAISLFSTVLNQAVSASIPIVIDDLCTPANFHKLKELRYICLNKEHNLLSEVIGEL